MRKLLKEVKRLHLSATNSPFTDAQAQELNHLLNTLTLEQRQWLSGYLMGTQTSVDDNKTLSVTQETTSIEPTAYINNTDTSNQDDEIETLLEDKEPHILANKRHITILYGSESGNAMGLAEIFADRLTTIGHQVTLQEMDDFDTNTVNQLEDLFIITSTYGEGDPPDNAWDFYDYILSPEAAPLDGVRYSVLALGDQTYEYFCQAGKDFDARLEQLGAERIYSRIDCDIDYEESAEKWMAGVINTIDTVQEETEIEPVVSESIQYAKEKKYSKTNPYYAEVLSNYNLNKSGSNKETRHIEFLLDDFGEAYEPGDCLGIIPENDPQIVDQLIHMLDWDSQDDIVVNDEGETLDIKEALTKHFEITKLTKPLLENAAAFFNNETLAERVQDNEWIKDYIYCRDLVDLISDFPPVDLQQEDLRHILRKLPPREYSISSSFLATPDEVHITVGAVRYQAHNRNRNGVCSVNFAERIKPGDLVPLYLKRNPNFKFPQQPDIPVIMIGPGTGIAPFRAHLQEREELGFKGNTWLFFGEQHRETDFLYQEELEFWLANETLTKLDVAFSRDSETKDYVQHHISQHSEEINDWINQGAAIYICGDEKNMAKDVHQAIKEVLVTERHISLDEAENILREMRHQQRYQRDVY